jgi:beta-N-acetylhexosaminidase
MRRLVLTLILLILVLIPATIGQAKHSIDSAANALDLLESMTPEEKIGQLFLVTFTGNAPNEDDPIIDLIANHHISGVLLKRENDNFVGAPETLEATRSLIANLQNTEYEASLPVEDGNATSDASPSIYVPLFIAVNQEGGSAQYSEILSGISELPNAMAIGATWDTEMARSVGEVLGQELEALGINLLLGPSLDVLEEPRLVGTGDLGIRSFGGDPFWVSVMGQAYVTGLHDGSNNRLGVVVKHFPGLGGADRPIEEEVATIRKSLEQLKQIELAPFFSVTSANPGEDTGIADGVLISHIRYQGFQGNIRDTTRPVSLDPQAHDQLMALEPIASWREGGGIMVSDSLGSRAIRRFRDPREWTFKAHLVALDAFLAGNDLLILSNFVSSDEPDEVSTILSTLSNFAQKYREDSYFAQLVDNAVLNILQLKMRLFGNTFLPNRVTPPESRLSEIGQGMEVTNQIARASASLISPSQEEIEERLGGPPQLSEKIVFFTDVRTYHQCSTCEPRPAMDVTEIEDTVLALYGQAGAGHVGSWNLHSYTMADLAHYLGYPPQSTPIIPIAPVEQLEEHLQRADWLVFSVLNSSDQVHGSNALKLLLDQRPDLARSKRVVVFTHDVPYGLDTTDISKIDVYYALYTQGVAFIDVAAHLLFMELSAPGAPPVSVPGISYDLIEATSPDPSQVISLTASSEEEETTSESDEPFFSIGDFVNVETGIIYDANNHPVPDRTPVEFTLILPGENTTPLTLKTTTQNGVAQIRIQLDQVGLLSISATSDPARVSETLQLNIQEGSPTVATIISPTDMPTITPLPSVVVALPTSTTVIGEGEPNHEESASTAMGVFDLFLGMLGVGTVAGFGYLYADNRGADRENRVRYIFLPIIGGLIGYNYLALNLPGSAIFLKVMGDVAGLAFALVSGAVGFLIVQIWIQRIDEP